MLQLNNYIGWCENETHIERKGDGIELETFEYKGCWNCQYFKRNTEEVMMVKEAADKYKVSKSTIRRWCRIGKLQCYLCEKQRFGGSFDGSSRLWIIKSELPIGNQVTGLAEYRAGYDGLKHQEEQP